MKVLTTTLNTILADAVNGLGYEYLGCDMKKQSDRKLLRIYCDNVGGLTLEACSKISRHVSALLKAENGITEEYNLEVSSPGVNRPLFELSHYQRFIGSRVQLTLHVPVNSLYRYVGLLEHVIGDNIHLQVHGKEMIVPFSMIEKGQLVSDF